ncbi:peroxisome biogenesis factor 2-like [Adelges cooleyi]|uniref:peroxisome biogenesis factor 2-like n=1 Tax=Adelges cooleyi TaxID=133065 RepID=UPI00217F795D|nr:peroxisome biogenesis factor 2-like [Adelges cooleyi]
MVPRVTLLDAQVLDEYISKILIDQTVRALKCLPTWIVNDLSLEINTFLQCLLTYYSVSKSKASFGQQLLGVKYKSDQLTGIKLVLLNILTIGGKYVASKVESPSENFINKFNNLETIFIIVKVASFLNFLMFLRQGKYPTLAQRILNLTQESTRRRTVGYEYMTRELLWHGFSELLLFTLPLVNYQSVKHKVKRLIYSYSTNASDKWIDKSPILNARTVCTICQDKPILPHHMKCSHVFCYYCIKTMRMVDEKFVCPDCCHYDKDILPVIIN